MATKDPNNVTSIKQAEHRRVKARRRGFLKRVLPYALIFTVAGIGGVASLRSMPAGTNMPAANAEHRR